MDGTKTALASAQTRNATAKRTEEVMCRRIPLRLRTGQREAKASRKLVGIGLRAHITRVFTGIVEEMGVVVAVDRREGGLGLTLRGEVVLEGLRIGDSVAVMGVCLTATRVGADQFDVDAVPETLARTTLGALTAGAPVNLERALAAGRPMGGHYVQGHVDGTAHVVAVVPDGEALNVEFEVESRLATYVVEKGFVAVDGVSLTVVRAEEHRFSVTLVPHTQQTVTLGTLAKGARVNVELDVMAKYVERSVGARLAELEERLRALEAGGRGRWV